MATDVTPGERIRQLRYRAERLEGELADLAADIDDLADLPHKEAEAARAALAGVLDALDEVPWHELPVAFVGDDLARRALSRAVDAGRMLLEAVASRQRAVSAREAQVAELRKKLAELKVKEVKHD